MNLGCFLLQFAIHPFSTNWQSAGVSECTCSKYRFLQTPEICVVCLFATAWNMCRVPIYQNVFLQQPRICAGCLFTKLLDILDYRQPSCRQENTEEMLMFISSLQPGCQPCFSFAERNNLRLFFPSLPCFSCSAPKLSPLRNFSLAENMRILFFFAYCLYSLIFVFLKEDCFLSGFVENWRFSVDV